MTGFVRTVLGDVPASDLGRTMAHEHLLIEFSRWKREAGIGVDDYGDDPRSLRPISLATREWVARYGKHADEHRLTDEAVAIEEAKRFKAAGGGTIVDATNPDLTRNPEALVRISKATGLHIVMGSGRYYGPHHPLDMDARTERELAEEIVRDITEGADGAAIRAGIIGEIGAGYPVTANEEKALRAAVGAQRTTGAALLIHPGRDSRAPEAVMRIVENAGGDASRTIVAHIDRTLFDRKDMRRLAETGCYLEFDLFGQESSYYQYAAIDMPNDAMRVDHLRWLIAEGFGERLLVSQDICRKSCLVTWGGWGYAHILENVVPVMARKGMTSEEIETILIANPARVLALGRGA